MRNNTLLDDPPPRAIVLEGSLNFRDLGGYLTPDGSIVRWRQVFRSDSLDGLTAQDTLALRHELESLLAIDLRSGIEAQGESDRAPGPISSVRIPLLDTPLGLDPLFVPGVPLEDVYCTLLCRIGDRIAGVLCVIADARAPVVFHCGAGRDRTGLVAAVLLGVLGVSEDDIARDYALSSMALPAPGAKIDGSGWRDELSP
jgi:protein-tyrosine phosphatase